MHCGTSTRNAQLQDTALICRAIKFYHSHSRTHQCGWVWRYSVDYFIMMGSVQVCWCEVSVHPNPLRGWQHRRALRACDILRAFCWRLALLCSARTSTIDCNATTALLTLCVACHTDVFCLEWACVNIKHNKFTTTYCFTHRMQHFITCPCTQHKQHLNIIRYMQVSDAMSVWVDTFV